MRGVPKFKHHTGHAAVHPHTPLDHHTVYSPSVPPPYIEAHIYHFIAGQMWSSFSVKLLPVIAVVLSFLDDHQHGRNHVKNSIVDSGHLSRDIGKLSTNILAKTSLSSVFRLSAAVRQSCYGCRAVPMMPQYESCYHG